MTTFQLPLLPQQLPKTQADWQRFLTVLQVWGQTISSLGGGQIGYTGTITTAKLTSGGSNGSMTFAGGVLTAETAAT